MRVSSLRVLAPLSPLLLLGAVAACGSSATKTLTTSSTSGASVGAGGSTAPSGTGGASPTASSGGDSTGGAGTSTTDGTTTSTGPSGTSGASSSSASSSSGTSGPSGLSLYVTPNSAVENDIVDAINAARKSVHMTMYILDNEQYVNALVNQKKAGLDVKVVLNQNFPSGTNESNPTTYTTLTNAGVGVVWRNGPPGASSGAYTHEKTFILDGTTAWFMTMNLDNSSQKYNREYLVVDTNAADAAEADTIFTNDFNGDATTNGEQLVVSPINSRSDVVALIDSATKTLDVEVEEFADTYSDGVTNAVAAAAKRGVATRVVLANQTASTDQTNAIATVKAAGAHVVVSGGTDGTSTSTNPYIHAKAIIVDCAGTSCTKGFVGSENFTATSLGYNRELGLYITDKGILETIESTISSDFAAGTAQ